MNKVKRQLLLSMLVLSFIVMNSAVAGEFEAAQEAVDESRFGEALTHFSAAAKEGNPQAQFIAGAMLWHGDRLYGPEVKEDRGAATRYFQMAAAQGHEEANLMLSRLLKASQMGPGKKRNHDRHGGHTLARLSTHSDR